MLYQEFLKGTGATEGKQSYNEYKRIEAIYMENETMTKEEAYNLYHKPTRNRQKQEKAGTIKVNRFKSQETFEEYAEDKDLTDEITIIETDTHYSADLMTTCKSYKTAINRLFKALENISDYRGWKESIIESYENGCYHEIDRMYNNETNKIENTGNWAYGVEQPDDNCFYIFCNVRKVN